MSDNNITLSYIPTSWEELIDTNFTIAPYLNSLSDSTTDETILEPSNEELIEPIDPNEMIENAIIDYEDYEDYEDSDINNDDEYHSHINGKALNHIYLLEMTKKTYSIDNVIKYLDLSKINIDDVCSWYLLQFVLNFAHFTNKEFDGQIINYLLTYITKNKYETYDPIRLDYKIIESMFIYILRYYKLSTKLHIDEHTSYSNKKLCKKILDNEIFNYFLNSITFDYTTYHYILKYLMIIDDVKLFDFFYKRASENNYKIDTESLYKYINNHSSNKNSTYLEVPIVESCSSILNCKNILMYMFENFESNNPTNILNRLKYIFTSINKTRYYSDNYNYVNTIYFDQFETDYFGQIGVSGPGVLNICIRSESNIYDIVDNLDILPVDYKKQIVELIILKLTTSRYIITNSDLEKYINKSINNYQINIFNNIKESICKKNYRFTDIFLNTNTLTQSEIYELSLIFAKQTIYGYPSKYANENSIQRKQYNLFKNLFSSKNLKKYTNDQIVELFAQGYIYSNIIIIKELFKYYAQNDSFDIRFIIKYLKSSRILKIITKLMAKHNIVPDYNTEDNIYLYLNNQIYLKYLIENDILNNNMLKTIYTYVDHNIKNKSNKYINIFNLLSEKTVALYDDNIADMYYQKKRYTSLCEYLKKYHNQTNYNYNRLISKYPNILKSRQFYTYMFKLYLSESDAENIIYRLKHKIKQSNWVIKNYKTLFRIVLGYEIE